MRPTSYQTAPPRGAQRQHSSAAPPVSPAPRPEPWAEQILAPPDTVDPPPGAAPPPAPEGGGPPPAGRRPAAPAASPGPRCGDGPALRRALRRRGGRGGGPAAPGAAAPC